MGLRCPDIGITELREMGELMGLRCPDIIPTRGWFHFDACGGESGGGFGSRGQRKGPGDGEERCTGETDETCLRAIMQKMMQEEARIYFDGFKGIHLLTQLNYRK
jgi:hypothetical protein